MALPTPQSSDRPRVDGTDADRPRIVGPDRPRVADGDGPRAEERDRPRVERLEVVRAADRPQVRRIEPEVYRVTSAKQSLTEAQRFRTKRYLISMSIRTVCFLAAVFSSGPWRWVFLVGAVVLPYVAVIMANAGRENDPFPGPEQPVAELRGLERGPDESH